MMPLSPDALYYRGLLFNLSKPVTLLPEKFDEFWPFVDSVYSKLQQELLQNNGTIRVQDYECRVRKSRKSGTHSGYYQQSYKTPAYQYPRSVFMSRTNKGLTFGGIVQR